MASLVDSLIPSVSSIGTIVSIVLWGLVIIIPLVVIALFIRGKIKYRYHAEIFKKRQYMPQRIEGKAGYFKKRGKTIFKIKYGIWWWQIIELSKLPDPEFMIDNKVYYEQLQKDCLIQCKLNIDWKGDFELKPAEDDAKFSAYLDLHENDMILSQKKISATTIGIVVLGLIITAGIIVFYFLSKA